MEFIKKYGSYQKKRIYIDNSKLENESINMKEFRKLKGRFYKKTNQWIFPLNLNEKTEPQIIIEEKVSVESQSIDTKMDSVTDEEIKEEEEVESVEEVIEEITIKEEEEVESVEEVIEENEEITINEEEETESVEEISIKEETESMEEISIKEEEEVESVEETESVEEISIKEEEEVRENKYLCVDEVEHTESESDVCSSICVDEVQKFSYIMKPPQELYDTLDDFLKLIDKKNIYNK